MTWNPRDDTPLILDLVNIQDNTGDYGFLLGIDGIFTDTTGKVWTGSRLLTVTNLQSAIDGVAPAGSISLSYVEEPGQNDLITRLKASGGVSIIAGRPITFYYQPILSVTEFYAPTIAPQQWLTRTMRTLTATTDGAQDRVLSVGFEAWSEDRRAARRKTLDERGHGALVGAANPSLEFMPSTNFEEEKLFG